MNLLILGYSALAHKRIFPAALAAGFERIEIASRIGAREGRPFPAEASAIFSSYETALAESRADVVYISTVNSLHAELAGKALRRGFHVVVDKPAFLTLADTHRLTELAAAENRCLAEALVWQYHPRVQAALREFGDAGDRPLQILSAFSFPPLPATDFRYRARLGGGAIFDLAPYAATPARIFQGASPEEIFARCHATRTDDDGEPVDTAFSLICQCGAGRSLAGSFGYTTAYSNWLRIAGAKISVAMDRVFSPPANLETELVVKSPSGVRKITVSSADNFEIFLRRVIGAVSAGEYTSFTHEMRSDAETLARIRDSAFAG